MFQSETGRFFRKKISSVYVLPAMALLSFVLHLRIFQLDLIGYHVWRQTQTQTVINNFYQEDMNILNPRNNKHPETDRIERMEFPVMQWLFACVYKVFGNHIVISRLLSFVIGLFSIWGIFRLLQALFRNEKISLLGAWAFTWSPVFYYYTLNPMPDNMALCCGIWSLAFFFMFAGNHKKMHLWCSSFFLCLSVLAKLPFIVYLTVPLMYVFYFLKNDRQKAFGIAASYLLMLLPAFAWYVWVIPSWKDNGIVAGVFDNLPSAQRMWDILIGNIVSTLPELLINYGSVLFFIAGFYFLLRKKSYRSLRFRALFAGGMAVIAYFLFEMNMIGTAHDYYMLPFLPFIFMLVAYGVFYVLRTDVKPLKYLAILALAVLPVTAFVRADSRWNTDAPGFNRVYYFNKEKLQTLIVKDAYCVVGNDYSRYILLYYLNRKGWAFDNDELSGEMLQYYRSKGAQYLFTDGAVDQKQDIRSQLGNKIFEADDVRVYELR